MSVDGDIGDFANRVAKRYRHLRRWAARERTDCFRVYDRDLPDMAFTLDVYGPRLFLQWYPRGDERPSKEWLDAARDAVAQATDRSAEAVVLRVRRRMDRRHEQHERQTDRSQPLVVTEDGLTFLVDLERYVDTGLFLDHRPLRHRVRQEAAGRSVLNLFCYTGSFSVHAMAGGAQRVVSVDMSNTYLAWARQNLEMNGFKGAGSALVRADVTVWLREAARRGERFDLIVLDPPAFSTSKKMDGAFDVQRDHGTLLRDALALMTSTGALYFSTNLRSFRFEADLPGWRAEDITESTIPADFRDSRIHRCWRVAAR